MTVEAVGICALGIVVGGICWYFVLRLKEYTIAALSGIGGFLFGGVVLAFLESDPAAQDNIWWYPIGLLAGSIILLFVRP